MYSKMLKHHHDLIIFDRASDLDRPRVSRPGIQPETMTPVISSYIWLGGGIKARSESYGCQQQYADLTGHL